MSATIVTTPIFKFPDDPSREPKQMNDGGLYPVPDWPPKETADQLGQLSGVAIDSYGNAVIFHSGDRTWNMDTFREGAHSVLS